MTTSSSDAPISPPDLQTRSAQRVAWTCFVLSAFVFVAWIVLGLLASDGRLLLVGAAVGLVTAVSFVAGRLARAGRAVLGIKLVMSSLWACTTLPCLLVAGGGPVFNGASFALTNVVAYMVFGPRSLLRVGPLALGFSLLGLALDHWGPAGRYPVPMGLRVFIGALVGIAVALLAFLGVALALTSRTKAQEHVSGEALEIRTKQFRRLMAVVGLVCIGLAASEIGLILAIDKKSFLPLAMMTLALGIAAAISALIARANRLTLAVYFWSLGSSLVAPGFPAVATGLMPTAVAIVFVDTLILAVFLSPQATKRAGSLMAVFVVAATAVECWPFWQRVDLSGEFPVFPMLVNPFTYGIAVFLIYLLGNTLLRSAELALSRSKQFEQAIDRTRATANELAEAGNGLLASATQQVAGHSHHTQAIAEVTVSISQVRSITEELSTKAQQLAEAARQTDETSKEGQASLQAATESILEMRARMERIGATVRELSEYSQRIEQITATVRDIAEQSHVLAINASIVAAREGEHGRSFSVVAAEMRRLASQSRQATVAVEEILAQVQRSVQGTLRVTDEGAQGIDASVQRAASARGVIEQLATVIAQTAGSANEMAARTGEQFQGIQEIAGAMSSVNVYASQMLESTRLTEAAAKKLSEMGRELHRSDVA